jgi:N4-gp56 family major capsid protein
MWKMARNLSFINKFAGSGPNAAVQRINELRKDEKGTRAVMTLIADLVGDGVAGDSTLEGNEEVVKSFEQVIRVDQLRHANRHTGRLAEQKSVVNFRMESRDVLAYWLSDRMDQLAFLTLAGLQYSQKTNGAARPLNSQLPLLEYAADIKTPTSNRWFRWDQTNKALKTAATNSIVATDFPSYDMIVALKAYAKTTYLRGIRGAGGEEYYHLFVTPQAMSRLKLDPNFLTNIRYITMGMGDKSTLAAGTGSTIMVDGVMVHEYRHVPNTLGLASGSKWGSGGTVDGNASLFLGAQALGFADIGDAEWVEKEFDYENSPGISSGKIFGFLKPQFYSIYTGQVDDFGVIRCDTAI